MINDKVNVISAKMVAGCFENYEVTVNVKGELLHDFLNYIDKYRTAVRNMENILWLSALSVS